MPASTGPRQRLSRRAKLQGVDYAVLSSGQQIPEYSSEDDSSEDDESYSSSKKTFKRTTHSDDFANSTVGTSNGAAKRKRKASVPDDCFICQKESKSAFMQCEICSRWCVCLVYRLRSGLYYMVSKLSTLYWRSVTGQVPLSLLEAVRVRVRARQHKLP